MPLGISDLSRFPSAREKNTLQRCTCRKLLHLVQCKAAVACRSIPLIHLISDRQSILGTVQVDSNVSELPLSHRR
jgi:hypothetical protein